MPFLSKSIEARHTMSSSDTCLYHQEDGDPLVVGVVQVGAVKLASGAGALEVV